MLFRVSLHWCIYILAQDHTSTFSDKVNKACVLQPLTCPWTNLLSRPWAGNSTLRGRGVYVGNRNTTSQKLHRTKSQSVENTSDHNVGNILNRIHSSSSQKQLLPGGGDSIRRYARNMNRLYFLHEFHEAGYLKSSLFKGYTSGSNTTQPFICVRQCLRIPGIKSRKQLGLKTHLWIPN